MKTLVILMAYLISGPAVAFDLNPNALKLKDYDRLQLEDLRQIQRPIELKEDAHERLEAFFRDSDGDGINDLSDNCVGIPNPEQADMDGDGVGNPCDVHIDWDVDQDGIGFSSDNCVSQANPDQADMDGDQMGDLCDEDIDGDQILNQVDNCPMIANEDQMDSDANGRGDLCDLPVDEDRDADGIDNASDNCTELNNPDQADLDGDQIGDACDEDLDGDGILNDEDNCPLIANSDQVDSDTDGRGDLCDMDIDAIDVEVIPGSGESFGNDDDGAFDVDTGNAANSGGCSLQSHSAMSFQYLIYCLLAFLPFSFKKRK